jgi:hypothetical protein
MDAGEIAAENSISLILLQVQVLYPMMAADA